jgi:hypothetical protein
MTRTRMRTVATMTEVEASKAGDTAATVASKGSAGEGFSIGVSS